MDAVVDSLRRGELPPWQAEEALAGQGLERFRLAAETRRAVVEELSGVGLAALGVPDRPFRELLACPGCDLAYDLVAWDEDRRCSLCGRALEPRGDEPRPLVASYVGGVEDFYSWAGLISVRGDVARRFVNLIQYGTGLGPIGAARGCFLAEQLGGVEVSVGTAARALRALCFAYPSEAERDRAWRVLRDTAGQLEAEVAGHLAPWGGVLGLVEPMRTSERGEHRLWLTFVGDFEQHRGHHAISKAVGAALPLARSILEQTGLTPAGAFIAQGYDGDLKPAPRNFRGRYARAAVRAPVARVAAVCRVEPTTLAEFVRIDAEGTRKLGHPGHTGMGGEILAACYKATKVNPHSPLVSATEAIAVEISDGELEYAVEMPNIEAGILSTEEGLVPPLGREALRVIGISSSREFAAWCAGLVLAAELNLSVEIARGRLYRPV